MGKYLLSEGFLEKTRSLGEFYLNRAEKRMGEYEADLFLGRKPARSSLIREDIGFAESQGMDVTKQKERLESLEHQ